MRQAFSWLLIFGILTVCQTYGCSLRDYRPGPHTSAQLAEGVGIWRDMSNWSKIKKGMSSAQVIRLLGRPTRRDEFGFRLFWEGYVDEAYAVVSGNVSILDNQVWDVDRPVW